MFKKDGSFILDCSSVARPFPKAEYERWKKEYEKTLTPEERKKAAKARALLKRNQKKSSLLLTSV